MTKWLKSNGKPISDSQGIPIDCPTCPCGSVECREAVDNEVTRLLNLTDEHGQYIWSMGETYTPQYTCAVWTQDAETGTWELVSMADGKLACAFLVGKKVSDTTSSTARFFVYAKTLYSSSLEKWITVGCECRITDHECKHRMASLDDYNVGGLLDVYKPDESDSEASYEPSDACQVDICELAKLKLQSAHDWHYGGNMVGEGYVDWWSDPQHRRQDYNLTKYIKGLIWTDVEIDESDSEIHEYRMLTYIPCSCDNQYPMQIELTAGKKTHSYSGICSMESNCQSEVLWTLRTYLDEEASDSDSESPYVWQEVASVATDFVCAEYDGYGTCITPSSGHLCLAFSRTGEFSTLIATSNGVPLVTATTIYNSRENKYRTIGCRCYAGDDWRYPECSQTFYNQPDVCIGGVLPVAPDNCDRNACAVYPCDEYQLQWSCYADWYGVTLYGEGYLLRGTDFNNYTKFSMAIKWYKSDSYWYAYVDCGCTTGHTGSRSSDVLPATWSLHELAGMCSNPECEKMLVLKQVAQDQGWTWHDEGTLVHLAWANVAGTFHFGNWYSLYTQVFDYYGSLTNYGEGAYVSQYKGCAESATDYWLVNCDCSIYQKSKSEGEDNPDAPQTIPSNYWRYLDVPNICSCSGNPIREVLLSYPDVLGVEDMSLGNDTLYEGTYTADGGMGTTTTVSYGDVCTMRMDRTEGTPYEGRRAVLIQIDYRCLCFILKCFNEYGQEASMIRTFYPEHSYVKRSTDFIRSYHYWIFDSCSFNGHITPFAMCNDIYQIVDGTETFRGWAFGGMNYGWRCTAKYIDSNIRLNTCPIDWTASYETTQADVENEAGCNTSFEPVVINWGYDQDDYWQGQALLSPDWTTGIIQNCATDNRGTQWNPDWYYKPKIYSCGVQMGQCDKWLNYHVQWNKTNLGYIVKGMGGYQTSFTILGPKNLPSNLKPWWIDPEDFPDDEPMTWTPQTDMEWCISDFEYDFSDSEDEMSESESESESISVSQGE